MLPSAYKLTAQCINYLFSLSTLAMWSWSHYCVLCSENTKEVMCFLGADSNAKNSNKQNQSNMS